MARPFKIGLDYFPMDTELDLKLRLLKAKFGLEGIGFYDMLLRAIYAEGYYIKLDDDKRLLLIGELNITEEKFDLMIEFCIQKQLFSNKFWKPSHKILTSIGVQKRYFHKTLRRNSQKTDKYILISVNDNPDIDSNNPVTDSDNATNKIKEKKRKENKIKEDISAKTVVQGNGLYPSIKQGDFIDELIARFSIAYKTALGFEYMNNNNGKNRSAIGKILASYKKLNPRADYNQCLEDFSGLFNAICTADYGKDNYHAEIDIPLISSDINKYIQIINKKNKKYGSIFS